MLNDRNDLVHNLFLILIFVFILSLEVKLNKKLMRNNEIGQFF